MILSAAEDSLVDPKPTALYRATAASSAANSWTSVNGWACARVCSSVNEEYAALTEEVGVFDMGALCRYTARGIDAATLLSRLTTAPVKELDGGESARGVILDSHGNVVDLADVSRLSGDLFLLTTSMACDRRLQLAARGFDAEVENITGVVAALGVLGPKAKSAAAAAGFELTSEEIAVQGRVRGVETSVRSINFGAVGGVEIIYPADEALTLWERMRRAAKPTPVGLDACEIIRIEGGAPRPNTDFRSADHVSQDFARTPVEIGVPHLAPLTRTWFNGRRALAGKDGARRLVTLSADIDTVDVGATIFFKSSNVGRVTSAAYSPRLHAAICFGEIAAHAVGKDLSIATSGEGSVSARILETVESSLAAAFLGRRNASV
jgi:aminomethyltransferase